MTDQIEMIEPTGSPTADNVVQLNAAPAEAIQESPESIGNRLIDAIGKVIDATTLDPNIRLNALASLYAQECIFGGIGIDPMVQGTVNTYRTVLMKLRAAAQMAQPAANDSNPV